MNDRHQYERKILKEDQIIGKREFWTSICGKIIKEDTSAHKKKPIISNEWRMAWMQAREGNCIPTTM